MPPNRNNAIKKIFIAFLCDNFPKNPLSCQKKNFCQEKKFLSPKISPFFDNFGRKFGDQIPEKYPQVFGYFSSGFERAGSFKKWIFGYRGGSGTPKIGSSGRVFLYPTHH